MYRNAKLLEVIREVPCGICGAEDGTVVAAHRNENKGMSLKVSDAQVAALCYACHSRLDQGKDMARDERRAFWNAAYINTMTALIEAGKLRVK